MTGGYRDVYTAWERDPLFFWEQAAEKIDWFRAPTKIFDESQSVYGPVVCQTASPTPATTVSTAMSGRTRDATGADP